MLGYSRSKTTRWLYFRSRTRALRSRSIVTTRTTFQKASKAASSFWAYGAQLAPYFGSGQFRVARILSKLPRGTQEIFSFANENDSMNNSPEPTERDPDRQSSEYRKRRDETERAAVHRSAIAGNGRRYTLTGLLLARGIH